MENELTGQTRAQAQDGQTQQMLDFPPPDHDHIGWIGTAGKRNRRTWPATPTRRTSARSAISASSPTSTPARRRPPSASSTTPARSTGWGTSTRETRRPTTCEEERERGITIVAAAITCRWKDADGQADHDQHHRHPRPRRLHRRGRAVAPRARRRGRRLLGRRGSRGPERDRLAAGGQVSCPADLLHQQDGPHRRRVRAGLPGDRGAAAGEPPDPGPDPHRRRARRDDGRVPGPDRPDHDEGPLSTRPRTWARRSPRPRSPTSSGPTPSSGARRCSTPSPTIDEAFTEAYMAHLEGAELPEADDHRRAAASDLDRPGPAGPLRVELQVRRRPAAARRGRRLPAQPARSSRRSSAITPRKGPS